MPADERQDPAADEDAEKVEKLEDLGRSRMATTVEGCERGEITARAHQLLNSRASLGSALVPKHAQPRPGGLG